MNFKSVSVNNCYILDKEVFNNPFFSFLNAKAIYSASIFHLAFFKGDTALLTKEEIKQYEIFTINLYRLNSPYLYIPFEINYHENYLYQSYYESDHFPLSVWIEEKNLIPFNIFIQIIEDILKALNTLEKMGHSHLFLTPEEILIPLQWKEDTHVKLYNIGLNSIVHSVFDKHKIGEYRNNYYKGSTGSVENKLIKNISEDLYSFGNILNRILPLCNFNNDKDKLIIKAYINRLIENPESFNSIEEVMLLFNSYFVENNKPQTLNSKTIDYSYTGQASFDIPEFNDWQEEAELEPLPEQDLPVNEIKSVPETIKKSSILKSVSTFLSNLFSRKNKDKYVSKTLLDFTEESNISNKKNKHEEKVNSTDISKNISGENRIENNYLSKSRKTENILKEIENHYKSIIKDSSFDTENEILNTNHENFLNYDSTRYSERNSKNNIEKENQKPNSDLISTFKVSLLERDYSRCYEIISYIQKPDNHPLQKNITKELGNVLDNKLKMLNDHYIKNDSTNIIIKLAKLDSIKPMEGRELKEDLIKDLKTEDNPKNNLNLFHRILLFLKTLFRKLK